MSSADGACAGPRLSGQLWPQLVFAYLSLQDLFYFRSVSREAFCLVNDHFRRLTRLDFSKLTNARFTWSHFYLITQNNVSLRSLNMENVSWINEAVFSQVLQRQHRLVSLDLSRAYEITNKTLFNLTMFCPMIEKLSLRHCSWLTENTFLQVVNRCQRLIEIDVASCWNLNDHCISVLFATRGSTLRRVGLASIYSLSDQWTRDIDIMATSLTFLDISSCWRMTDNAIKNLSGIDSLEQIVLADCSQISFLGHRHLLESGIKVVNNVK